MSNVRLVDAGVRHDETQPVRGDENAAAVAHHLLALGENHLDNPRILADGRCELDRARRRRDVPQIDVAPFRLRNDFLCDHEYVAIARDDAGSVETRDENGNKIVPGLDHRHARYCGIRDARGRYRHLYALGVPSGIPVIRIPAPSIL